MGALSIRNGTMVWIFSHVDWLLRSMWRQSLKLQMVCSVQLATATIITDRDKVANAALTFDRDNGGVTKLYRAKLRQCQHMVCCYTRYVNYNHFDTCMKKHGSCPRDHRIIISSHPTLLAKGWRFQKNIHLLLVCRNVSLVQRREPTPS